jgi:hypothetical protein
MNRQATRHIVPSQARGYADRSNRERRDSRHPAIASRRVLSRRNQIRVSRAPRVRARAVNLMLARSLFRGRCRSRGSGGQRRGRTYGWRWWACRGTRRSSRRRVASRSDGRRWREVDGRRLRRLDEETGNTTGSTRRRSGGQGLCGSSNSETALRKAQPRKAAWRIREVTSSPTARTRSRPCSVSACSVARAANMVVRTVQVGDDQVDLAGEVPVERRERDLALLDDPLDP